LLETPRADAFAGITDTQCITFAQQISFAQLIPFEESPLDLHSLGSIFSKPTVLGIGALVGFAAVGFAATPLLLVTVPAGIVIVGAAKGVGEALEKGLADRLQRFMGMPEPAVTTSPNVLPSANR
jgi:hypothetical protein